MRHVAITIRAFGIYLLILGGITLITPNTLLDLFGLPRTDEVWIRVAGMLLMGLGYHYTSASLYPLDMVQFYRWSVWLRPTVFLFFLGMVLLDLVGYPILYFGVGDVVAAAWTGFAMRRIKVAHYTNYKEGNDRLVARLPASRDAGLRSASSPEA